MGWQFLSVDDRQQLTDELAELGQIRSGVDGRTALLTQAGLAAFLSKLHSLANSAAWQFAAELVTALENKTTLPTQPRHQLLGLLLEYVLGEPGTPQSTRAICARLIICYRLIDDEELLARLTAEFGAPETVTPWRDVRHRVGLPPSVKRLNIVVAAVVGVLAILLVAVVVAFRQRPLTVTPLLTEYAVALSVAEGCPEAWSEEMAAGIAATVNEATPDRPVTFDVAAAEADLVLNLECEENDVVWQVRFAHLAPIFEMVGSPQEFSLRLPASDPLALVRLGRGLIYYGRNDFSLAEEPFSRLVSDFDPLELQWLYANTLLLNEKYEPAVAAFDKLVERAEGDTLALAYNNRALAHFDEKHRVEGARTKSEAAKKLTFEDIELALAVPLVAPDVVALINSNFGVIQAMLSNRGANLDQAKEACLLAQRSRPEFAWSKVCQAAVLLEPRKFEKITCDLDLFTEVDTLLDTAEKWRPEVAATYYWQIDMLYQRTKGCAPQAEVGDYKARCEDREQRLNALRQAGLAPLFLHQYLINKFPDCTL